MKRVYVAGSYSASNVIDVLKNIGRGEKVCAQLFFLGFAPFCPWHDKSYVMDLCDKEMTVQQFYDYSIAWLDVSDCMYVLSKSENSKGVKKEIEVAEKAGIPIFHTIEALLDWKNNG